MATTRETAILYCELPITKVLQCTHAVESTPLWPSPGTKRVPAPRDPPLTPFTPPPPPRRNDCRSVVVGYRDSFYIVSACRQELDAPWGNMGRRETLRDKEHEGRIRLPNTLVMTFPLTMGSFRISTRWRCCAVRTLEMGSFMLSGRATGSSE